MYIYIYNPTDSGYHALKISAERKLFDLRKKIAWCAVI